MGLLELEVIAPAARWASAAAAARGIEIVNGNVKCLGGMVGVDDAAATAWLKDKLVQQSPITNAIKDPRFPLIHALRCAKINNIPKPIFLLRAMPLRITQEAISAFDRANRLALTPRLLRCSRPRWTLQPRGRLAMRAKRAC